MFSHMENMTNCPCEEKEERSMKNLGYYNGAIAAVEQMQIPMNDRSNYFGDGIYEVCLVRNGIIFAFDEHIDRFYDNLTKVRIAFERTKEQLKALLQDMVDRVEGESLSLYWQVSRGTAKRNHLFPAPDTPSNLLIMIDQILLPKKDHLYKLKTVDDIRSLRCDIKSLNLLPNVLASQLAKDHGCEEAVLHRNGIVTECAHSNLFYLKDKTLYTAPLNNLILPGITRSRLIQLSKRMGIAVCEASYPIDELMKADEIIVTSTTKQCVRVCEIDQIPVGLKDSDTFLTLQNAFFDEFNKETGAAYE